MKEFSIWIKKAEHDLKIAIKTKDDLEILDCTIFHTQQCAEKALKAYLAYKEKDVRKTHDLELLIKICSEIEKSFMSLFAYAVNLNPYYMEYRYPIDVAHEKERSPELSDVYLAIDQAKQILDFVKQKISVN
jgi:HEPN domain-containing protein